MLNNTCLFDAELHKDHVLDLKSVLRAGVFYNFGSVNCNSVELLQKHNQFAHIICGFLFKMPMSTVDRDHAEDLWKILFLAVRPLHCFRVFHNESHGSPSSQIFVVSSFQDFHANH